MHRCISSLVWGLVVFWELTLTTSFRAFSLLSASPWPEDGRVSWVDWEEQALSPCRAHRVLQRWGVELLCLEAEPRRGRGVQAGLWGAAPHLLHQHLHVVGAAPAVGFHDEAEAQGH